MRFPIFEIIFCTFNSRFLVDSRVTQKNGNKLWYCMVENKKTWFTWYFTRKKIIKYFQFSRLFKISLFYSKFIFIIDIAIETSKYCSLKNGLNGCSNYIPELSMGVPAATDSGSFISTTTQSDIKKVLATEAACSRQHLTTCARVGCFSLSKFHIKH